MSALELLTSQPNFPDEDLAEKNVPHVEFYLQHERSNEAFEHHLRDSLRIVHKIGHNALEICGVTIDYSEAEYNAFCGGFAALEYTSMLVREKQQNDTLLIANTRNILIESGEMVDFEVASRYATWTEAHPNTYGVIVDTGAARGETMKQLQARTMGACVAGVLQGDELWGVKS